MYICDCGERFKTFQEKANHVRWQHKKVVFKTQKSRQESSEKFILANERRFGKWIEEKIPCSKCSKEVLIKYRKGKKKEKYFCSRSCANTRIFSVETKQRGNEVIIKI